MSAAPPVVFHQPKHARPDADHHQHAHHHDHTRSPRARLPVIPDLRFEYSYMRSIQPYVHVERLSTGEAVPRPTDVELVDQGMLDESGFVTLDATLGMQGKETEKGFAEGEVALKPPSQTEPASGPSEIIHLQWKKIAWVTVRDQVISPLVQGAAWALASYYIRPFSLEFGSRMGTFVHQRLPTKEGLGVSWLRDWAKSIGLTSSNAAAVQRKS
ncbi:hypothetical protein JR316_0009074 [Psilocybe cubensis]|uniref:Uncharacterized protein n=2 Tax=Psilocybe cubensis TaxID=181762 RepID=A0A8H8CKP0_PSICU|nr:hypothetical protein JR316_0009074 [Psilocybe cubensis]KAH9478617.1 hypothetical protein JR316_0009074 [Psilocybe cubensis]